MSNKSRPYNHILPHQAARILCKQKGYCPAEGEIFFVHDVRCSRLPVDMNSPITPDDTLDMNSPITGIVIAGKILDTEVVAIRNFLNHLRTMRSGNV